jgi:hypothetical protein
LTTRRKANHASPLSFDDDENPRVALARELGGMGLL